MCNVSLCPNSQTPIILPSPDTNPHSSPFASNVGKPTKIYLDLFGVVHLVVVGGGGSDDGDGDGDGGDDDDDGPTWTENMLGKEGRGESRWVEERGQ